MTLQLKLQTVTGPIPIEEVTLADAYAHVWIQPPKGVPARYQRPINDPFKVDAELKDFRSAGGSTLVDCQPGGAGRDATMLAKFSAQHGLHITATTGFHLEQYYPSGSWPWTASEQAAADFFTGELTTGLKEYSDALAATVSVGFAGKIEGQTRILMEAAAQAAQKTNAPLMIQTREGHNVELLPLFFEDRGIPIKRLYLGSIDQRPDIGLHQELAQAGALLGYTTFAHPKYKPKDNGWPLLLEMVRNGFEDKIAIGLDLADQALWRSFGGQPGLVYLPDRLLSLLHGENLTETVVSKLTAGNIAQLLAKPE